MRKTPFLPSQKKSLVRELLNPFTTSQYFVQDLSEYKISTVSIESDSDVPYEIGNYWDNIS